MVPGDRDWKAHERSGSDHDGLDYIDTNKQVGDVDHVKGVRDQDAAQARLDKHDPEGVAFEYPVSGKEREV